MSTSSIPRTSAPGEPNRDDIARSPEKYADHLNADQDILYELLLKRGLDLCVPIETIEIVGRSVHSIRAGSLSTCLAESIDAEACEALAPAILARHLERDPAGADIYEDKPIRVMVEGPVLRDSRESYFIQAADCVAFLLK